MMSINNLLVRPAFQSDARAVVDLLSDNGRSLYWKLETQWDYFYRDYPEGRPLSLIAEIDGKIIGHYGLLPVKLGKWPAMLGLHAYIAKPYRGLTVLSMLMEEVDRHSVAAGAKAICGFANPHFSLIKKTFFKWKVPFWLGFKSFMTEEDLSRQSAPFYFSYSDAWFDWRFGARQDFYISRYVAADCIVRKQLLKIPPSGIYPSQTILSGCEGWSKYFCFNKQQKDQFCQPFSVKAYDQELIDYGIYEAENWFVEMGDSDTFQYLQCINH